MHQSVGGNHSKLDPSLAIGFERLGTVLVTVGCNVRVRSSLLTYTVDVRLRKLVSGMEIYLLTLDD